MTEPRYRPTPKGVLLDRLLADGHPRAEELAETLWAALQRHGGWYCETGFRPGLSLDGGGSFVSLPRDA